MHCDGCQMTGLVTDHLPATLLAAGREYLEAGTRLSGPRQGARHRLPTLDSPLRHPLPPCTVYSRLTAMRNGACHPGGRWAYRFPSAAVISDLGLGVAPRVFPCLT
eukprot:EG_transcript_19941